MAASNPWAQFAAGGLSSLAGVTPLAMAGGGMTGGAGGNAGPSSANADGIQSITPAFDASNWTVSTGSGKASASNASGQAGSLANIPWMYIAIAGVVGLVLWKRL